MLDFTKINFGRADAHTEGEEFPDLLTKGYVDISQVIDKALHTSTFLFLGYKGSGKSSLSEHLRLTQEGLIVDQQRLNDFPFKLFDQLSDSEDRLLKYKCIWRFLLCVQVFSDLSDDCNMRSEEVERTRAILTREGILPIKKLSDLISKSTAKQVEASIKLLKLTYSESIDKTDIDYNILTDYLKELICSFKEEHSHMIVIDDLDDILEPRGKQFYNIAALINEAKDLNIYFKRSAVPAKILILCRTDMFDRLPDPNINKIKQDKSFTFSWYREGINNQKDSDLIKLINIRARIAYPEIDDVFVTFFPEKYDHRKIYSALLDYTRHTPRDFVQLINYIQKYSNSDKVTTDAISKGVKDYSTEYFRQEISNEMAGYIPGEYISGVFNVLSAIRKKEFPYSTFVEQCRRHYRLRRADVDEILRVLYECSAIGQVYMYDKGVNRITFKYRNQTSYFNPDDRITIHKGLWKALNVNY